MGVFRLKDGFDPHRNLPLTEALAPASGGCYSLGIAVGLFPDRPHWSRPALTIEFPLYITGEGEVGDIDCRGTVKLGPKGTPFKLGPGYSLGRFVEYLLTSALLAVENAPMRIGERVEALRVGAPGAPSNG